MLLPSKLCAAGARLRHPSPAPALDAEAVLARELVVQNGVCRIVEDYSAKASYYIFTFEFAVESDDRSVGLVTVAFNASARSAVPQPETFYRSVKDELEDDPETPPPAGELDRLFPVAVRAAQAEIRRVIGPLEESANRRLARDAERVHSYYGGLVAQIHRRIARAAGKPEAGAKVAEREQARLKATEIDRAAKLEDLVRKYSLRVQVKPLDVLIARLPAREIVVRLLRKKEERKRVLHWNPALRILEPLLCDRCSETAHPLYLCEAVHCLCKDCWSSCPRCGRFFCRLCRPRCKCESAQ